MEKNEEEEILRIWKAISDLKEVVTTNRNDMAWMKKILSPVTFISLALAIISMLDVLLVHLH